MTDVEQYWGWLRFADVLLHRAAVLARAQPNPGWAARLEGADETEPDPLADLGATVIEGTTIAVAEARDELKRQLDADSPFASVCAHAALTREEAEAFAVLAAVELDADRQELLERIYGAPWLTPFSLSRIFDGLGMTHIAVAPDGGLRRGELILPLDGPSWATCPLRLAPVVPWWLLGEQPCDADLPADAEAVDVPARGEHDLVVMPRQVGQSADRRVASDRAVGSVVIVEVDPAGQGLTAFGV